MLAAPRGRQARIESLIPAAVPKRAVHASIHNVVKMVPEDVASDAPPKKFGDHQEGPPGWKIDAQTSRALARLATPSWEENSMGCQITQAQKAVARAARRAEKKAFDIVQN
jgi:hypothetical protein